MTMITPIPTLTAPPKSLLKSEWKWHSIWNLINMMHVLRITDSTIYRWNFYQYVERMNEI